MQIKLDPMQGYVKDGKFDLKTALESIGVKAAVCFKEQKNGLISQEDIRTNEDSATLITRGVNTIPTIESSTTSILLVILRLNAPVSFGAFCFADLSTIAQALPIVCSSFCISIKSSRDSMI